MSQHGIEVGKDENCTIGWDDGIESFFFQSGEEEGTGEPKIWLGFEHRQYLTATELAIAIQQAYEDSKFRIPKELYSQLEQDRDDFLREEYQNDREAYQSILYTISKRKG